MTAFDVIRRRMLAAKTHQELDAAGLATTIALRDGTLTKKQEARLVTDGKAIRRAIGAADLWLIDGRWQPKPSEKPKKSWKERWRRAVKRRESPVSGMPAAPHKQLGSTESLAKLPTLVKKQ